MSATRLTQVSDLTLDLANLRTIPQPDEASAIQAMIAINAKAFWALTASLIENGYLPTENILVLKTAGPDSRMVVKEGNRRIAALKLIHCDFVNGSIPIASHIVAQLPKVGPDWKKRNARVPCTIYKTDEAKVVDKIIALAHGKGEGAGRSSWNAVARARHSRDFSNSNEPGLDLLEKYFKHGTNFSEAQAEQWAGEYPLTVLEDVLKRLAPRIGLNNSPELAKKYPAVQYRDSLDAMFKDIGLEKLRFKEVRDTKLDFASDYGIPPIARPSASGDKGSKETASAEGSNRATDNSQSQQNSSQGEAGNGAQGNQNSGTSEAASDSRDNQDAASSASQARTSSEAASKKTAAVATKNQLAVKQTLVAFKPMGINRDKLVSLRDEAILLNLEKTPLAFCFLLRSMFEISAKAYCNDHKAAGGPSDVKADGKEKNLIDVLRDIYNHLVKSPEKQRDSAMLKRLHGALTELAKPERVLSVTSMNQLVHNPAFSATAGDISVAFGNVYPLLEAMNS